MSRDDEKRFGPRQSGNDVLDHAVGEIFLLRIAAHVLNGSTAMEGLSGRGSGCAVSLDRFVTIAGEEIGAMRTRQTRIGSAIFFKNCGPISS